MRTIKITGNEKLNFLCSVLGISDQNPYRIEREGTNIKCDHDIINVMLERYENGKTSVLPCKNKDSVLWMVLNKDYQELIKHYGEIEKFIVPAYAESYVSEVTKFNPSKGDLSKYGSTVFENGYLCFRSPFEFEDDILKRLNLWAALDMERPERTEEELKINAYTLRSRFSQAIASGYWEQARDALDSIKQSHLLSYENCKFLEIRLLRDQGKWDSIWNMTDFKDIAKFKQIPLLVRETLLMSFYKSVVLDIEGQGDIKEILDVFKKYEGKIGNLLKYRTGLKGDVYLRLFAYNAAFGKKMDKLERLLKDECSNETREIVEELIKIAKPGVKPPSGGGLSGVKLASKYYEEYNYDEAYQVILTCEKTVESVRIFLGIATMLEVGEVYKQAADAFLSLKEEERALMLKAPSIRAQAKYALEFASKAQSPAPEEDDHPSTWSAWFKALYESKLGKTVFENCVREITLKSGDVRIGSEEIDSITENLIELMICDMTGEQRGLMKFCIQDFVTYLINDVNFPNSSAEGLYGYVMEFIKEYGSKNEYTINFLLKLSEARLQIDINNCEDVWDIVEKWLDFIPNLKYSFYVLELLELFKEYGMQSSRLSQVWNNWIGTLINQFDSEKRTELISWSEIGKAIGGDNTLLKEIGYILEEPVEIDPISGMDECAITIYSLRQGAPEQAAEEIKNRNPKLKVRICKANTLTTEAEVYAKNSDIVIITTRCMSHALTYGITPYLKKDPIYPRSSGKTGIIQALEEYAITA